MAKKLIRLTIDTDTEETYDIVSGILTLMISFGWEEKVLPDGRTRFLVHCENAELIEDVRRAITDRLPGAAVKVDSVEQEDWVSAWKEFFTPVACGSRFVVLPPWRSAEPGFEAREKIFIEPKSAFGTGHHATTSLCLEAISGLLDEGRIRKGQTFLDLGTGSGVLSVGLCKSGLSGEGYDIDPIAVDNAVENRALNHISAADYTVGLGSIEKTEGRTFDVVVANILAGPESLEAETYALADKLARRPLYALARQKAAINAYFYGDIDKFIVQESEDMHACSRTNDFNEAVTAFLEKRAPEFKGN